MSKIRIGNYPTGEPQFKYLKLWKHMPNRKQAWGKLRLIMWLAKNIAADKQIAKKGGELVAPFNDAQIAKLVRWQSGVTGMHPFTCCSHDGCDRIDRKDRGILIPLRDGWICPCGNYKQYWCHTFMVE